MGKRIWKPGTVIYPLPCVIVSCGTMEKSNLITVAWTGIISTNPPRTYISLRKSRFSYDIIKDTKEFCINLTTKDLVKATDLCGVKSGRDIDKFYTSKLTPFQSQLISAPSIMESPINIECKVFEIKELGSHDMFMADIISVTTDDKYYDENDKFLFNNSNPICYSHGEYKALGETLGKFGYSVKKKEKRRKK